MSKQVWICEKCQSLWQDEEAAKRCEQLHAEPIAVKGLLWPKYAYGRDRRFPETIQVKIGVQSLSSNFDWDYAIYTLEHIGPKAV